MWNWITQSLLAVFIVSCWNANGSEPSGLEIASPPFISVYQAREVMRGRLIADATAISSGKPFSVGLLLQIQPGWHTYGNNAGDAGISTAIRWELPPGFKVAATHWPAPKPADFSGLHCNIYTDEVLVIAEIVPPQDLKDGSVVLRAHATCGCDNDQVCLVPTEADCALDLPVGSGGHTANAALFNKYQQAYQRLAQQ